MRSELLLARAPWRMGFCERYFRFKSARFDVPYFALPVARTLATAWALKMQHYWDIYSAQDNYGYKFSQYDNDSFTEPDDFVHVFNVLDGRKLARAQGSRDLRPR